MKVRILYSGIAINIFLTQIFIGLVFAKEGRYLVLHEGSCNAEPIVGNCLGAHMRWYWNKKSQKCENHIWSGCGPGGLGFPSQLSCHCACAYCHKKE